jgi:hypothetical protein
MVIRMPTLYPPQLSETATPMMDLWDIIHGALLSHAQTILTILNCYERFDLERSVDGELNEGEQQELNPIIRALMEAVQTIEAMPIHILISTLRRIARNPAQFFTEDVPAAVEYAIACNYQRASEKPGTFCLDVWGGPKVDCPYPLEAPTQFRIAQAAERACSCLAPVRSRGRPRHIAIDIVAEQMGSMYRASGHDIVRRLEPTMVRGRLSYAEAGPFYDFLTLVLKPLNDHLRERRLPTITLASVVRHATEMAT